MQKDCTHGVEVCVTKVKKLFTESLLSIKGSAAEKVDRIRGVPGTYRLSHAHEWSEFAVALKRFAGVRKRIYSRAVANSKVWVRIP